MDKPLQNPITEEEAPRSSRAADVRQINAEKDRKFKKSKEIVLNKQTYLSPDITSPREKEYLESKTEENKKGEFVKENGEKFEIQKNRESFPEPNSMQSEEIKIDSFIANIGSNLESSKSSISTRHGFRKSTDSSDGEPNSDLSEDLIDYENLERKKHKRQNDSEDVEEKFRRHFLKTFQGMPRLSQISLEEPSSKTKDKNGNVKTIQELPNKEETSVETLINEEHEIDKKDNNSGHITEE